MVAKNTHYNHIHNYAANFSKGEISPSLYYTPAFSGYYESVRRCQNLWITAEGKLKKRPGLVGLLTLESDIFQLMDFRNSRGSNFLLVATVQRLQILNGDTGEFLQTLPAPLLTESVVANLGYASYHDAVILTAETLPPQLVKWHTDNSFTIETIEFDNPPSWEFAPNDVEPKGSLTPSARTGYATLTSSVDAFQSTDVGGFVSILPLGRFKIAKYNGARSVAGYFEEAVVDTASVSAGNWTIERGWRPLMREGAYPRCCGFWEGRLFLGDFAGARDVVAWSMATDPLDFLTGDGSIVYGGVRSISGNQENAILHIVPSSSLYFFTAEAEFFVDQSGTLDLRQAPIRKESSQGAVVKIRPREGEDGGLYFFQPRSKSVAEFRYFFERGSHESRTITTFAGHLVDAPRSGDLWKGDGDFQTNILFWVNQDGTLVSGTISREQHICGFTRNVSDGEFLAVCCCGNTVFVVQRVEETVVLRRFVSGIYDDDGTAYESFFEPHGIMDDAAVALAYDITLAEAQLFVQETEAVFIDGQRVYEGELFSGRLKFFGTKGFSANGRIRVSDGARRAHFQLNNLNRIGVSGGGSLK